MYGRGGLYDEAGGGANGGGANGGAKYMVPFPVVSGYCAGGGATGGPGLHEGLGFSDGQSKVARESHSSCCVGGKRFCLNRTGCRDSSPPRHASSSSSITTGRDLDDGGGGAGDGAGDGGGCDGRGGADAGGSDEEEEEAAQPCRTLRCLFARY